LLSLIVFQVLVLLVLEFPLELESQQELIQVLMKQLGWKALGLKL